MLVRKGHSDDIMDEMSVRLGWTGQIYTVCRRGWEESKFATTRGRPKMMTWKGEIMRVGENSIDIERVSVESGRSRCENGPKGVRVRNEYEARMSGRGA